MRRRVSIVELLALVAVAALGLAAMRDGSDIALGATLSVTILALLFALLAALLRARPVGAWAGFALFGWAAFLLAFIPYLHDLYDELPGAIVFQAAADSLQPKPARPAGLPGYFYDDPGYLARVAFGQPIENQFKKQILDWDHRRTNSLRTGKAIGCLILALAGSLVGRWLVSRREPPPAAT